MPHTELSIAVRLAGAPAHVRNTAMKNWNPTKSEQLLHDWHFWARPKQLPPPGDWRVWLLLAGRGFGKTRCGAEWVSAWARHTPGLRLALVAATLDEARSVMVEGDSGLLHVAPPDERPKFEPSRRRLAWANGAQAFLYSAQEADALRGPQHHGAWADELAKWPDAAAVWAQLQMGLRLGAHPRTLVTTTPRPLPFLQALAQAEGTALVCGASAENDKNLAPGFLATMEATYGGTAFGRQELLGEFIEDIAGSLWPRALLEACRVVHAPDLVRMVVAVDPPASAGAHADACGIIVAGVCAEGIAYVVADATVQGLGPDGWARAVASAAARHQADRVIAEANQGGAMVQTVLHGADATLPVRLVHATRGKAARAEPVAALYERGQVRHAGVFAALEDQMCGLLPGGAYAGPGRSPDRADALVWAITELMLSQPARPSVRGLV
jgi:phage terminase large subunit-like protein